MILHLRNYRVFLISIILLLFLCVFLIHIQTEIIQVVLYDIRSDTNDVCVFLEFKANNNIYRKKITEKTKKIRLKKSSELYSVEHDNLIATKVLSGNNTYEIYIFPNKSVIEQENSYLVKEAQSVYAYFVEYYDYEKERNYYIFSKDNIIDKKSFISYENTSFDLLNKLQEEDLLFYNEDTQVLSFPYAGYVIKDEENNFILLSDFWDTKLIH